MILRFHKIQSLLIKNLILFTTKNFTIHWRKNPLNPYNCLCPVTYISPEQLRHWSTVFNGILDDLDLH